MSIERSSSGSARYRSTSSRSAPITVSRQGTCSTRAPKAVSRTGRPLRSSGRPTKRMRNSPAGAARRRARRRVDVDPVGNDRVVAAVPAAAGPGGRLGDGDPGRKPVEHAAGAEPVGDVVRHRLGRVGVEGADDRGPRPQGRVPADQRRQRLVNVDHVELLPAHLTPRRQHPAGGKRRQVADGAVDPEAHRPPQRRHVVRHLARFRRRPVQHPADPARGVVRGKHANVVAAAEKLLSKRLHMPIHAALVGPGIWRDESYAHEGLRVDHRPASTSPVGPLSAQAKPAKTSR